MANITDQDLARLAVSFAKRANLGMCIATAKRMSMVNIPAEAIITHLIYANRFILAARFLELIKDCDAELRHKNPDYRRFCRNNQRNITASCEQAFEDAKTKFLAGVFGITPLSRHEYIPGSSL